MVKLRTLLIGARISRFTPLPPKLRNTARWSSIFEMISRYCELRDFLCLLNPSEINEISLTLVENRKVDDLFDNLKLFESVSKALQKDVSLLSDVRAIFDAVIGEHPSFSTRLSANASIVHCMLFESAVVQIQRRNASVLLWEERQKNCVF